jgi:NAD(P)-dependent dehydrogenase (short-subunit alcohol dehydrogenase family)
MDVEIDPSDRGRWYRLPVTWSTDSGPGVIVTGGGGDIGRGVCRALTKAGFRVAALDLDLTAVEDVAVAHRCDVTDPDAAEAAVRQVVGELVNMAQQRTWGPLLEATADDLRVVFESGPIATLRMMQLCHPHLKAVGGGAIVNFASAAGTAGGIPGKGAYAAAKEAIRGLTKQAAVEWGPDRIRVNAICPLATHDPDRWSASVVDGVPLGRLGDPEMDIGGVVVFLAGTAGGYITGRTLLVDGGVGTFR